jgi:hypothetical protein
MMSALRALMIFPPQKEKEKIQVKKDKKQQSCCGIN